MTDFPRPIGDTSSAKPAVIRLKRDCPGTVTRISDSKIQQATDPGGLTGPGQQRLCVLYGASGSQAMKYCQIGGANCAIPARLPGMSSPVSTRGCRQIHRHSGENRNPDPRTTNLLPRCRIVDSGFRRKDGIPEGQNPGMTESRKDEIPEGRNQGTEGRFSYFDDTS